MPKLRPITSKVKAALALAVGLSSPAMAGDLVVTATRVETESEKLGSAVTVITAEEIERKQARTVAEVLRDVPGLAVSNTGGKGRDTAIRIRGAEAHHTKVIVDGIDLSDPSRAQPSYDFGHLLAADIERVEVVRGPQSLLYGGDAVGGVINIVTRRGTGAPRVTAFAETGSLRTHTGSAGVSGSADRVSYALTATHFQTDGIPAAAERDGNGERDPYWNQTVTGRVGARLTDIWGIEANGRLMRAQVDYDGWSGLRAVDDGDRMDQRERSGRIATDLTVLDGRLTNVVAFSLTETERDIGKGKRRTSFYDGETREWEYQGTARLAPDHTLVFGAETRTESTRQSSISDDVENAGYYADYQFSPLESLFVTAGGRLDDHQSYGTHKTWRGTAAYLVEATRTRLHGSYGTGFRAPSLFELYEPTYGNHALRPEESRGWDIGVEQTMLDGKAVVDVTWFDSRIQDMIQWSASGYDNIASTRAQGLETTARWQVAPDWRLNATHTYTESRNNRTGQVLARRPRHQGSLGVGWSPLDGLTADATLRAVGRQYDSATSHHVGGFATVDLAVAYDVTDWARVFGRVENLADKQYEEVDTYGSPGRMGFVGVKATF